MRSCHGIDARWPYAPERFVFPRDDDLSGRSRGEHLHDMPDLVRGPRAHLGAVEAIEPPDRADPKESAGVLCEKAGLGDGQTVPLVELLDDAPEPELREILTCYRELLAGNLSGREVWTRLQASNRVGVTRGALEQQRDPLAIL